MFEVAAKSAISNTVKYQVSSKSIESYVWLKSFVQYVEAFDLFIYI